MGNEEISSLTEDSGPKKYDGGLVERVETIAGISGLRQRDDSLLEKDTSEKTTDVIVFSRDPMEEDISILESGDKIISEEDHRKIANTAFVKTLSYVGEYLSKEKLDRLFPGLDTSNVDSYDFSNSRYKVIILSSDNYDVFKTEYSPDGKSNSSSSGFAPQTERFNQGDYVNKVMGVDLSERKLILVREFHDGDRKMLGLKPDGKIIEEELNTSQKNYIHDKIEKIIVHELLHTLGVARNMPTNFMETVTEWYTQLISNSWYEGDDGIVADKISVGYNKILPVVSILFNTMLENGVERQDIDKAFISCDEESQDKIKDFIESRYGEEAADKIWNWSFKYNEDPIKFMVNLESGNDSEIGRFLKTYGAKRY